MNGQDSDYPEGQYVEAVFVGHTHENHIFYNVSTNPDSDNYMDHPPEYSETSLDLGLPAFYIETTTATKWYG